MKQFEPNLVEDLQRTRSHHKVSRRAIIVAIIFFALIVVGMFTFAFLKKSEMEQSNILPVVEKIQPESEVKYASVTRITAKHFFSNGLHTLVGEIPTPTPCELLESSVTIMESYPEQIRVDFSILNTSENCIQIISSQRFKEEIVASKNATFQATFEGRPVEFNLIPAAEGESPDSFELFIKG